MMTLTRPVPLYERARASILKRISAGAWKVGAMLPNETVLAAELDVSQGTMRRALDALENEGFLERKQGRGTYLISCEPTSCPHCGRAFRRHVRAA